MRQPLLTVLFAVLSSPLFAQHSLVKLWESDSVTIHNPESALYDPITNSLYVSSTGSGSVVRMTTDGKVIQKNWVTGLQMNMGSALYNGRFYTTNPKGISVVDVNKASFVKVIPVPGAVMLNDVAVDSKGVIYVSDTRAAKVYRITGDSVSLFLENMPGANGLLTVNSDVYLVTSTTFFKIDANKQVTKIADGFESGLDGIVMVADGEFILSNYTGLLWYVKSDGSKQLLLDSRSNGIMSNDISYDKTTKTLYVPSYRTNRIIAYKVN